MFFSPSPRKRRLQLQISERRLLLMAGDVVAVCAAVLIALRVWAAVARYAFTLEFIYPQVYLFVVLVALWLLLAGANDFYDLHLIADRWRAFQRLMFITAQMVVIYVVVFFVSPRTALPRLFILYYGVASFILISLWRMFSPAIIGWASEPRRVLVVGADKAAQTIIEAVSAFASRDYEIKGIIGKVAEVGQVIGGIPVIGTGADLMNFAARDRISELVITSTRALDDVTFQNVMDAYEHGITLMPMSLLYEEITGRVPVEHVTDDWAVVLIPVGNGSRLYRAVKRGYDIALALVGMAIFLLTLPPLALLIRLDSRGGTFYTQERVGLNGRIFRIYKYRSMVADAEAKTGAVFSQRGDPRVTRVGRIMRKTRLDELPQFVNVLRGDMSLIGPRPERPEHVQRLTQTIPFYRTRLIVRPGVTGWAQVRYDYGSNDEDALIKLQYDLYYIRHQSLILDLSILIRTVGKVLAFKGV